MIVGNQSFAGCLLLLSSVAIGGCNSPDRETKVPSDVEVLREINRLRSIVRPMPPDWHDAALHAIASPDPGVRAEAAISIGKSRWVKPDLLQQLEQVAIKDPDPIARGAAIAAIFDLHEPTPRIQALTEQLHSDPQLGALVLMLTDAN